MRRLTVAVVIALCSSSLVLLATRQNAPWLQALQADPRVQALIDRADAANQAGKPDDAHKRADESLKLAESIGDRLGIAMSLRMQGLIYQTQGLFKDAASWNERALAAFEAIGNKAGVAGALHGLAISFESLGDTARVRVLGSRAMALYEELGDELRRARVLYLLAVADNLEGYGHRLPEVLSIAERHGDQFLRAEIHKALANRHFIAGRYSEAKADYEAAIGALEALDDVDTLAAAHLSLGRVFRAHADYEGAIQRYQKAIDLLTPRKERFTLVEATNAKAIALSFLGRQKESLATYEQGLALAKESGNQRLIDFMEGNLAGAYQIAGDHERAIPALQAVIAKKPERSLLGYRYNALASSLTQVGREAEALPLNTEAVAIAREFKQTDILAGRLDDRAWILGKLGRYEEALVASREALAIVEEIRGRLVPIDFLKRGYGDRVQRGFARAVSLLGELGRAAEALEVAEQSRARAFLDLLTARELAADLPTRGAVERPGSISRDLASDALSQPLDVAGLRELTGRLNTTLVSYWVNDDTTLIWVTKPDGSLTLNKVPVKRQKVETLVAATTAALRPVAASTVTRGEAAQAPAQTTEELIALPMRGLGIAALSKDDKAAWRELYDLLIVPVRAQLPARGGRITIVPYGSLFQLSFAGLQSDRGRYLIEDYELHYAPAASALAFTGRTQQAISDNLGGAWAIIGNPATLPQVGERALSRLPGAGREIAAIAAIAPKGKALRFDGDAAHEAALAEALEAKAPAVLHFATHGFVFDDAKQPPFLALHQRDKSDAGDGRLTLDEVYRLRLRTDIVVLSACRTGSGQVSSDGIVGLTRAFFYAGSPSVMATFWDITDEATANLMTGFYRRYASTHAKSASLRAAQLALLADLRAGRVTVAAGGRRVTLPEHPLLWAGFFLSGEP